MSRNLKKCDIIDEYLKQETMQFCHFQNLDHAIIIIDMNF